MGTKSHGNKSFKNAYMAQMHKNMENSQGFSLENHVHTLLIISVLLHH